MTRLTSIRFLAIAALAVGVAVAKIGELDIGEIDGETDGATDFNHELPVQEQHLQSDYFPAWVDPANPTACEFLNEVTNEAAGTCTDPTGFIAAQLTAVENEQGVIDAYPERYHNGNDACSHSRDPCACTQNRADGCGGGRRRSASSRALALKRYERAQRYLAAGFTLADLGLPVSPKELIDTTSEVWQLFKTIGTDIVNLVKGAKPVINNNAKLVQSFMPKDNADWGNIQWNDVPAVLTFSIVDPDFTAKGHNKLIGQLMFLAGSLNSGNDGYFISFVQMRPVKIIAKPPKFTSDWTMEASASLQMMENAGTTAEPNIHAWLEFTAVTGNYGLISGSATTVSWTFEIEAHNPTSTGGGTHAKPVFRIWDAWFGEGDTVLVHVNNAGSILGGALFVTGAGAGAYAYSRRRRSSKSGDGKRKHKHGEGSSGLRRSQRSHRSHRSAKQASGGSAGSRASKRSNRSHRSHRSHKSDKAVTAESAVEV